MCGRYVISKPISKTLDLVKTNIKVGDTVKVGFEASRCHIFDDSNQAFK